MARGLDLISAAISEGGHSGISKLKPELFLREEISAYTFLMSYYVRYGELPSREIFAQNGIELPELSGQSISFQYHYDETLRRAKYNLARDCIPKYQDAIKNNNLDLFESLQHDLILDLNQFNDDRGVFDSNSIYELVTDSYNRNLEMRLNGVSNAILSGWEPLDLVVHGYRPGDLIVFAGRRGAGKSYILAKQALHAIISRKKVLYVTMEMQALSTANRFAAIQLKLNPDHIITTSLSEQDWNRLNVTTENFNQYPLRMIEGKFSKSVTNILSEVKEFRPDILFIDGSYLLKTDDRYRQRWEVQAAIHEELKTRIALDCNIPVVCAVQQNRASRGIKDGDGTVAGSDVIESLASVLVLTGHIKNKSQRRLLNIVKNRDGANDLFAINYSFDGVNLDYDPEETRAQRDLINGARQNQDQHDHMNGLQRGMT